MLGSVGGSVSVCVSVASSVVVSGSDSVGASVVVSSSVYSTVVSSTVFSASILAFSSAFALSGTAFSYIKSSSIRPRKEAPKIFNGFFFFPLSNNAIISHDPPISIPISVKSIKKPINATIKNPPIIFDFIISQMWENSY